MEPLRSGRYTDLRPLAEGAQGATFTAIDQTTGEAVVVKRFQVKGARSWKDVELAEREARVLGSVSHPLLPRYVEHFEEDGALYLVMEKVEGETLSSLKTRGISTSDVRAFMRDMSAILEYLHGRSPPIVHRDIKPSNVIRRRDGSFVLVDFGAVRDKLRPGGGSTVVGTFGYMAPEQFQGRAVPASDVYAVGATSLALLTGVEPEELPHDGLAIDVAAALGSGPHAEFAPSLSAMLEPNPDRRAKSVAAAFEVQETLARESMQRGLARPDASDASTLEATAPSSSAETLRRLQTFIWVSYGLGWWLVRPHVTSIVMWVWLAAAIALTSFLRRSLPRSPRSQRRQERLARRQRRRLERGRGVAPPTPRIRVDDTGARVRVNPKAKLTAPDETIDEVTVGDTDVEKKARGSR